MKHVETGAIIIGLIIAWLVYRNLRKRWLRLCASTRSKLHLKAKGASS